MPIINVGGGVGINYHEPDKEAIIDGLTRLLEYPETRSRIVQSARGRSKDFAQTIMLEKIEALLRNIHDKRTT